MHHQDLGAAAPSLHQYLRAVAHPLFCTNEISREWHIPPLRAIEIPDSAHPSLKHRSDLGAVAFNGTPLKSPVCGTFLSYALLRSPGSGTSLSYVRSDLLIVAHSSLMYC
jgi:hypothetical protein